MPLAECSNLTKYGRVIEIHFLANQISVFKDKDQDALHLGLFSSWGDSRPEAAMRTSEDTLHDHCAVCMI